MILIVGGAASGKRSYARSLGYTDAQMADGVLDGRPVIYNVQDLAFRSPESAGALLEALAKKEVVICCEVGSGVIPVSRQERLGREAAGRLCILLAARADTVVRMVCALPQILKGPAPQAR